jgi:hypothetical protein
MRFGDPANWYESVDRAQVGDARVTTPELRVRARNSAGDDAHSSVTRSAGRASLSVLGATRFVLFMDEAMGEPSEESNLHPYTSVHGLTTRAL